MQNIVKIILISIIVFSCLGLAKTDSTDKNIYLSAEEFTYSDSPRYTLSGRLPLTETDIRPLEFSIFTGITISYITIQHVIQMRTIWKDRSEFRIIEDYDYALYSDKVGHAYGSFLTANIIRDGLTESGISWSTSSHIAGFAGLAYSTYIEIMDGYGENWGFSPSDFYSDLAGTALFFSQYYFPFMQNFTPKFMYFPPEWHGMKSRVPHDIFIDDYSAHAFFLSADIHNILPKGLKEYWPPWLELSFGYTARNLCHTDFGVCDYSKKQNAFLYGDMKYIIALDYNIAEFFPEMGAPWDWLIQEFMFFKLPSPAVEIGANSTRFYLMYPFQIKIGNIEF